VTSGPVGVGIIGAGTISTTYLENLTSFPDVSVRGIADIDLERAAAAAEQFGLPGSGTVEELLADPTVEVVVNLTIPAVHAEVGVAALDAGKHVWSEKPLAMDRESARKLLDRAAERGLRVACAPDTVLGAGLQTARRAIEGGAIGTPQFGLALMQSPGPEKWHPSPEFLFAPGGGPLLDIGPYYLTALVLVMGPVARVTATAGQARPTRVIGSGPRAGTVFDVTVPTTTTVLLEFERGGSAQAVFSFDSGVRRTTLEIGGTGGTAVLPDPNRFDGDTQVFIPHEDEPRTLTAAGATSSRGTGVLELARAIRAGVPERASGELAYHVLDVMLSAGESAEAHRTAEVVSTVEVPPPLPADFDPHAPTLT
jgi:predicted dehydrogenase